MVKICIECGSKLAGVNPKFCAKCLLMGLCAKY